MEYISSPDVDQEIRQIIKILFLDYIDSRRVSTVRSRGSRSRRIIARCHGLPKALQTGMRVPPYYVIELVTENFDKLSKEEKIKTLIHELLHIPRVFGGGFRNHDYVKPSRINRYYKKYLDSIRSLPPLLKTEKRSSRRIKIPRFPDTEKNGDLFSVWRDPF